MRVREYGTSGPRVIVLHGGPGASGEMAPLARAIADSFRVLEPFERPSGAVPLTVAVHVADLRALVTPESAIVGFSWGAMLALAFAAAHPDVAIPLVLIGCGTFDPGARARLNATIEERKRRGLPLYSYDPISADPEPIEFDARGHEETWADMLRLQQEAVYPAAFAAIRGPVLMLHGAYDPHPGQMIRESLRPYLPQMEYREWERCGHSPWIEKAVRGEFFATLKNWLLEHDLQS